MNTTTETITDRPELWVPEHLAEIFPEVLDEVRQNVTPGAPEHRDWYDTLAGGWLLGQLRRAIAATKHGGLVPGTVGRPPHRDELVPAALRGGDPAPVMREWKTPTDRSPEQQEHWDAYRYSQRNYEAFTVEVEEAVSAVLKSPARAWEAYLYKVALTGAELRFEQQRRAEDHERMRLDAQQCPVCGDSDIRKIGPVKTRSLLGWTPRFGSPDPQLRSCLVCWEVAHTMHINRLVDEPTTAGRSRGDVVAAHLSKMEA